MDSLKGITDLMIVPEVRDKCGRKDRLPEEYIARMIELKLRQNGLRVAKHVDLENGGAIVSARISVIGECTRCSYIVGLKVAQEENMNRDLTILGGSAAAWKDSLLGICSCPELPNQVKVSLGYLLDDFMNDLRIANSRSTILTPPVQAN